MVNDFDKRFAQDVHIDLEDINDFMTAIADAGRPKPGMPNKNTGKNTGKWNFFQRKRKPANLCCGDQAYIANPLEYPLQNVTAERNFWRAAFWLLAAAVAGVAIANVAAWWFA